MRRHGGSRRHRLNRTRVRSALPRADERPAGPRPVAVRSCVRNVLHPQTSDATKYRVGLDVWPRHGPNGGAFFEFLLRLPADIRMSRTGHEFTPTLPG